MIAKVIFGVAMFAITLAIQFCLYKKGKSVAFWSGAELVFGMCILGLLSDDAAYFAGILGYVIGDYAGKYAGWHKYTK